MGGENSWSWRDSGGPLGSSPRGRGKPGDFAGYENLHGLIPAWAGKTRQTPAMGVKTGAHPRVGGENWWSVWVGWCVGLIPAWAGKTSPSKRASQSHGAHPRVGGENAIFTPRPTTKVGSSPRGRGKLPLPLPLPLPLRLIPAWAGKTPERLPREITPPAHPRVGGENDVGMPC